MTYYEWRSALDSLNCESRIREEGRKKGDENEKNKSDTEIIQEEAHSAGGKGTICK